MKAVLALAFLAVVAFAQDPTEPPVADECPTPDPVKGFNYQKFLGQWFEVGHYRNAGPSIWSEDCFCSTSNVTNDELGWQEQDSIYSYDCNLESPDGELQLYDTYIANMDPPGKWLMQHLPNQFPLQDLTVVTMEDTHALVYRCGDYGLAGISYTAQILSRKPSLDAVIINKLKDQVKNLKLNPENAAYVEVPHGNCTYEGH